ncbi:MAG: DNA primase [Kiritimatiellae bacterium]|nr:DNA primase [Kiritimatiellia bacterium]MDW8458335.1 DNA primase [Verrucomicrobiota bacterium]
MAISRKTVEEIRQRIDIVELIGSYVSLKRAGANYKALCPFHKEKTPSFIVNPARQIFHCFGCGAGGDAFKFIMLHDNVSFSEAVRLLAARAGVPVEFGGEEPAAAGHKDLLFRIHDAAAAFFREILLRSPTADAAREYLRRRQLDPEMVDSFGLGYAPDAYDTMERLAKKHGFPLDALEASGLLARTESGRRYDRFRNRLMFPIRDPGGRVIAFSGRTLSEDDKVPKYLNSPETPLFRKNRTLYALDRARKAIIERGACLLCEGQIDVIRCHSAGFQHAVAALGTAVTQEHASLLKRYTDRVILLMDADAAGQASALRAAELFLEAELDVEFVSLPPGEDPDSLIVKRGGAALQESLDRARGLVDYLVDVAARETDLATDRGIGIAARNSLRVIRRAAGPIMRTRLVRRLSERLNIPEHRLMEELDRLESGTRTDDSKSAEPPQTATPLPPEEWELLWLLAHRPDTADLIRRYVSAEHLADERTRTLLPVLLEHGDLLAAARAAGRDCVDVASEILTDAKRPDSDEQAVERAAQDLIVAIRRKALERALLAAQRARERAGAAEREQLTEEIASFKYQLHALRGGWERASQILDLL